MVVGRTLKCCGGGISEAFEFACNLGPRRLIDDFGNTEVAQLLYRLGDLVGGACGQEPVKQNVPAGVPRGVIGRIHAHEVPTVHR